MRHCICLCLLISSFMFLLQQLVIIKSIQFIFHLLFKVHSLQPKTSRSMPDSVQREQISDGKFFQRKKLIDYLSRYHLLFIKAYFWTNSKTSGFSSRIPALLVVCHVAHCHAVPCFTIQNHLSDIQNHFVPPTESCFIVPFSTTFPNV